MPPFERLPALSGPSSFAEVPANPALDPFDGAALDAVCARLAGAQMTILGQILDASNGVLLVRLADRGGDLHAVYKPTTGERPLWDFPMATLAQREVATYELSRHLGLGVVPPTVLREGDFGPGSVQWWVSTLPAAAPSVDVLEPHEVADDHIPVLHAETEDGDPLVVVHGDIAPVRAAALLDVLANNADRKGSALLADADGHVWGIDHGLTLHEQDKLRTVLWGWAGEPLTAQERAVLADLRTALDTPGSALLTALSPLVTEAEIDALRDRGAQLLAAGRWPHPPRDRYPVPWPAV